MVRKGCLENAGAHLFRTAAASLHIHEFANPCARPKRCYALASRRSVEHQLGRPSTRYRVATDSNHIARAEVARRPCFDSYRFAEVKVGHRGGIGINQDPTRPLDFYCLLYTSDAADDASSV